MYMCVIFFFNDPATTEIYTYGHTLSLPDALPISLADATRQYTNVVDGAQRIRALQSAVASGELSVDAARKAFSYGVGSNLDVLDELDVLFEADRKSTRLNSSH